MAVFNVPLSNTPQSFTIELAGVTWNLVSRWNDAIEGGWIVDWYDSSDAPICMNMPLITGADLGAQYPHLGIPSSLIVFTDGDDFAVPTLENLGVESQLYLVQK